MFGINKNSPYRKVGFFKSLVRIIVRKIRLLKFRITLGTCFNYGKNFSLGKNADIRSPGMVNIGYNVAIGKNFTVESELEIGNNVLISSNVSFINNDHKFDDKNYTVYSQGKNTIEKVILKGDNLIGYGVIIIAKVTIGKGSIVGAGAVVTKDIPPYSVATGIPARVIRPRFIDTE